LLIAKDLRRRLRTPLETLLSLALPLALAGVIGLAFGGEEGGELPPIGVAVLDHDDTPTSRFLTGILGGIDGKNAPIEFQVRNVESEAEAEAAMRRGEVAAMVELPRGLADSLWQGGVTELGLVRNPAQRILPEIVEQVVGVGAVMGSQGALILDQPRQLTQALTDTLQSWPNDGLVTTLSTLWNSELRRFERWLSPPLVSFERASPTAAEGSEEQGESAGAGVNVFTYVLPGLAFLTLLFLGTAAHQDLFHEHTVGTFERLRSMPLRPSLLLASKSLAAAALAAIGLGLLLLCGALIFDSRWGDPAALLLVVVSGAIAAAGTTAALHGLVRTQQQSRAAAPAVLLAISFAGGSMLPLESLPHFARALAPYTPNYWFITAMRSLMLDQPASSVAAIVAVEVPAAWLLLFGAGGFAVGFLLLRRRLGQVA
jgi:ABC-2 type transport system permease protein